MSKDQGQKRLLSPESNTTSFEDKRRRNNSIEIDDLNPSQVSNMEPQPTLLDLKKCMNVILTRLDTTVKADDLKQLATKQDLKGIDDRITANNQEISQLRDEMKQLKGNFDQLQTSVDGQIAQNMARVDRSRGHEPGSSQFNMATSEVNIGRTGSTQRRNLVIEGLTGDNDDEIKATFIGITSAIGVKVYNSEIEQVMRMRRRDDNNKKPGPVLLTLTRIVLRDNILKK